jgi:hypothetical protein
MAKQNCTPVYRLPSSPSSVLPPGNVTWASLVFCTLMLAEASSAEGFSRCKKRISGRASGSFTQSSSKNSLRLGGEGVGLGRGKEGEGTIRIIRATAALRGSGMHNEIHEKDAKIKMDTYGWEETLLCEAGSSGCGATRVIAVARQALVVLRMR